MRTSSSATATTYPIALNLMLTLTHVDDYFLLPLTVRYQIDEYFRRVACPRIGANFRGVKVAACKYIPAFDEALRKDASM